MCMLRRNTQSGAIDLKTSFSLSEMTDGLSK
jgi:hypothetical protein